LNIYSNTIMNKPIPFEIFYNSAEILKVMAHPIRLAIINNLILKGQLSVTEIYQNLEIEQSVVSYHLKNMRLVNLVNSNRKGTKIFYSIEHQEVVAIFNKIIELGEK
jgi:DNA-binding transcriptional ArsR family regulator